ncbi:DUF294 nucleotidyltransferase-like domain-containing protein [Thalassospira sp.]|uniref:DUF294 nucleotidyltransferase-like domain-containing protein n=1 Tax=Thalassospira sp. TaxID=1912094 RepID=UPI002733A616|nr:DUF294 nucleotidyltransferase-like domain-containing protein [Thalassospira sp.]MDP2700294.1 DUF294 nucleotidyltransferase-like domain-containing protein [Thalassospira sp.]
MLPATITENQAYSAARLAEMRDALARHLHGGAFCVVVTGSFGRHEASDQSDLDYFLIGREADRNLAPYRDVADILGAAVAKKPAANGPFSSYVPAEELVNRIGLDGDTNSITTRRLLFLLECEWLYNENGKRAFFDQLIANYVTDTVTSDSIARFLVNDVIRYYRTISVDFEIKTREGHAKAWAPRRLKLVFSRKMLYFGGIIAAAETAGLDYVGKRAKLSQLLQLPPIDRLQAVFGPRCLAALDLYDHFLAQLNDPETRTRLEKIDPNDRHHPEMRSLLDNGKQFSRELIALLNHRYAPDHPIHEALLM